MQEVAIPVDELHALESTRREAWQRAEEGQLADGYRILRQGWRRALGFLDTPWGSDLLARYEQAEHDYLTRFAVK